MSDRAELFARSHILLQVRILGASPVAESSDLERLRRRQTLIGFADPLAEPEALSAVAARGVAAFPLESIPGIARTRYLAPRML